MPKSTFCLTISAEEVLKYYHGSASSVQCVDEAGKTIRFPAALIRPHISHHGVSGRFSIEYNEQGKLVEFKKL